MLDPYSQLINALIKLYYTEKLYTQVSIELKQNLITSGLGKLR